MVTSSKWKSRRNFHLTDKIQDKIISCTLVTIWSFSKQDSPTVRVLIRDVSRGYGKHKASSTDKIRNRNLRISRVPLKSQVRQGNSLFRSAASNQTGSPEVSPISRGSEETKVAVKVGVV